MVVYELLRYVELFARTNLFCWVQDVHSSLANSSVWDPVSNTTLTGCGGVPTACAECEAGSGADEGAGEKDGDEEEEEVLVIEAYGVPDNEVLARAWCAHWGLSAVVADLGRTW